MHVYVHNKNACADVFHALCKWSTCARYVVRKITLLISYLALHDYIQFCFRYIYLACVCQHKYVLYVSYKCRGEKEKLTWWYPN